jgi:hypothetical protein
LGSAPEGKGGINNKQKEIANELLAVINEYLHPTSPKYFRQMTPPQQNHKSLSKIEKHYKQNRL